MADTVLGSVRAYRLADPGRIAGNAGRLGALLFGLREGDTDESRTFHVHPASGFLFYADYGRLGRGSGLPRDGEQAARAFVTDANRRVMGDAALIRAQVPALFPQDVRVVGSGPVQASNADQPDHWLCSFAAYLALDRDRTARVEGASIEVRIDGRGVVIGLSSRWRPVAGDLLADALRNDEDHGVVTAPGPNVIQAPKRTTIARIERLRPEAPAHEHEEEAQHEEAEEHQHGEQEEPAEQLLYRLADERDPQTVLAPMYLGLAGHHGGWEPASSHSLVAEIFERPGEVAAAVRGGSGNYSYEWGYWTLDDVFEQGVQPLGSGPTVSVPPGAYNVVLAVSDLVTDSSAYVETTVLAR